MVTVTVTVPGACAGVTTVSVVEDVNVTLVAAVVPKDTVAVAANPLPMIVTCVPPAAGPLAGVMLATVGAVEDDEDDWDVT